MTDPTPLAVDPDLFLVAPVTARSLAAPATVRDLVLTEQRLALPAGAPSTGIPMIWTDLSASATISSPGGYIAKTGGIVLTLAASARGGEVQIKAFATPITVVDAAGALFDVSVSTFTLSNLNEAVTLSWAAGESSWIVS